MSNILKGILNESNSVYGHSDPAKEYGAEDPTYRKHGPYYQTDDDDDGNPFAEYERQQRMFAVGRAEKAAKEKAQRDSDHDRLASGTNEGMDDPWGDQGNFAGDKPVTLGNVSMKNIQTGDTVKYLGQPSKVVAMSKDRKQSRITISKGMGTVTQDVLTSDLKQLGRGTSIEENNTSRMRMNDYYDLADAIQEKLRQAIQLGNKELIQKLNKERDDLDARVKQYGLMPESQLDEVSNEKLSQYKTAAAADASKADSEGDYKRGNKRFSGIVKATKKQFANDTKKSAISQGINELSQSPGYGGDGDDDKYTPPNFGKPYKSNYLGNNEFEVFCRPPAQVKNRFRGTYEPRDPSKEIKLKAIVQKYGLEWDDETTSWYLDSPGAVWLGWKYGEIPLPRAQDQARNPGHIHDLVSDWLNYAESFNLRKIAQEYFGFTDDGEMNEAVSEAPRFNSKQEVINHFVKNGKSAAAGAAAWERGYRGSSKRPIELKKPPQRSYHDELDDKRYSTFENLGDQLKSTSLEALVQAKLAIERQREADIEAWKQDFQKNTAQKAQQQLTRTFQPIPVAQSGEKYSVLKDRLKQLNIAEPMLKKISKLITAIKTEYPLVAKKMDDIDSQLLQQVKDGADPRDNYQSLISSLKELYTDLPKKYPRAIKVKKNQGVIESPKRIDYDSDTYDNPRMGREYGKGNLFVDPGSTEFKKEVHPSDPEAEVGRPKRLTGLSKALPADAFGRTTGKIPASARPTSKQDPFKEVDEEKQRLDPSCWKGYKKQGTKMKGDTRVNNCVPVKESSILQGIKKV